MRYEPQINATDVPRITNGAWHVIGSSSDHGHDMAVVKCFDEYTLEVSAQSLYGFPDDVLDIMDWQYKTWQQTQGSVTLLRREPTNP